MRYLLDTHALLWWLFDDPKLSRKARDVIGDSINEIFVSAASAWEISTKYRLGKLPSASELMRDMDSCFRRAGFRQLPISVAHAQRAGSWPQPHRDPFDRMLAAQSALESSPLVTCDDPLSLFGIQTLW